jgi:antiviral helicase SKI2
MPFSVASMQGTPFADISELTDVSEGLIVRTIVQLDET